MEIMKGKDIPPGVIKRMRRTFDYLDSVEKIHYQELVELIYKTVDFYYKHTVEADAVCSKGCSWCCRVPIDVTAIEAKYIEDKTGNMTADLGDSKDWHRLPDKTKCPFLKNDECSVYEFRPFNCRVFATLDSPDYCIDGGTKHNIVNYLSNNGLALFRQMLIDYSKQAVSGQGEAYEADVRSWFGSNIRGARISAVFIDEA